MEVNLSPELEAKLNEMSSKTGRAAEELVQDAMAGYLADLADVRETLDRRYDEIKSGNVKPIDGDVFFEGLRRREDELLKRATRTPKTRPATRRTPDVAGSRFFARVAQLRS
jgi:predicted DNA-binding protein